MESDANFDALRHPGRQGFDMVASSRLDADVPALYASWLEYGFDEKVQWKKQDDVHVAAFVSNCGASNGRLKYIEQMMKHIKIDSYGTCLNNKDGGSKSAAGGWFKSKINLLRRYRFTLAFENSNIEGYVSEKLFQPLIAGSVPVTMGAPNVQSFGPSEKSLIRSDDFGSPKELAEYLLYLAEHDDEYNEYLQWKKDGFSKQFKQLIDMSTIHSHCRLCIRLADMYRHDTARSDSWHKQLLSRYPTGTVVYQVRIRGYYAFKIITLPAADLGMLHQKVASLFANDLPDGLTELYHLTNLIRQPILSNADLAKQGNGAEIEAVYV